MRRLEIRITDPSILSFDALLAPNCAMYSPLKTWTLTETVFPKLGEQEYEPESEGLAFCMTRELDVTSPFVTNLKMVKLKQKSIPKNMLKAPQKI